MRKLTFVDQNSPIGFVFYDDGIGSVRCSNGLFGVRHSMFIGSEINWQDNYFIRADGIIVCALECDDPEIYRFHGQHKSLLLTNKLNKNDC